MKFNEFKPSSRPQLTEDQIYTQNLLKDFLESKITKKEFLKQIDESVGRDQLDEILPLAAAGIAKGLGAAGMAAARFAPQIAKGAAKYGGQALKGIKNFFGGGTRAVAGKTAKALTGKTATAASLGAMAPGMLSGKNVAKVAGGAALGAAAASALDTNPNAAYADDPSAGDSGMNTPSTPFYPDDPSAGDSGMNTTPAPTQRPKVAATAANTRDYDKTLAMQKKLIAQGANIKADGLMGPNTRAAMKAANMGAGGQKIRTDMPGGPRISNAKKPLMKPKPDFVPVMPATGGVAKPKPKSKPKPRTLGKQNSKMPRSFGGIGPRVDDPKGGETVNLPFGMSYKTLPQEKDDGSKG